MFRDRSCGLAHTRLAIIDLEGGVQPMLDDDGASVVVFNGEIFNYLELRAELAGLGYRFRTRSDTEVVVHALRAWGDDALIRFNGQFAIAQWRPRERTLMLARDRLGVRPLYVCEHAGDIVFASEVKAIFAADPTVPRALDPAGLAETFTFWTTIAPRTCFQGVEELRPGHVRTYTAEGVAERCYWRPSFPIEPDAGFGGTIEDATEALRATLARATALRLLRADVPVGCYVSGGLDSSVIAAFAHGMHGQGLQTFSLRFEDGEHDEGAFQRTMVRQLGSDHHEVAVSRAQIAGVFPLVIRHAERPVLRTAAAPMLLLARAVQAAGIKVVLTGEGADEMLAGYDLFREARVRRFWARDPASRARPRLLDRLYPYLARSPVAARAMAHEFFAKDLDRPHAPEFAHGPRWRAAIALQRMFSADTRALVAAHGDPVSRFVAELPAEHARWDPLARDQFIEIRTLLSGYLLAAQGDRMAMASSVEARYPFLDPAVVELACSLPAAYKLRVLDEKHVLKRLAAGLVPPEIVKRAKQPYRAPDAAAFTGEDPPAWIAEVLDPAAIRTAGVFDPSAVERLWRKCRTTPQPSNADNMALVGVLSTQLLDQSLIRARPTCETPAARCTVIDHFGELRR